VPSLRLPLLLALLTTLFPAPAVAQAPKRLNVVIITADDMNGDSAGWMGNKLGLTPNLDKFAAGCHRFVNCHVSAPICQPSRQALMTGRVPHHSGGLGFNPIRPDVPTLVTLLAAQGYFAAAINKVVHMAPTQAFPWTATRDGSGKNPKALRAHLAECLRAASEAKKAAAKKAFALLKAVTPDEVTVPSFLEELPDIRKEVAQYYTAIRRFDMSFGEILAELTGHLDDTLIIFLSDHGMSFPFSKASVYRNGTWSPVILRWPGMPPAAAHEEMVSSVDMLPTILDVLGIDQPADVDGRSWQPLLRGEVQPDRDHVVTHVNTVSSGKGFPQRCIRTKQHALMFHAWSDSTTHFKVEAMSGLSFKALAEAAKTDPRIKARVDQYLLGTPLALYDLQSDPDERVNRIDDPRYRPDAERLATLLWAHMERTNDPQLGKYKEALAKWKQ
jgi:N-sulfoglucosamine sulfohydrolase